jgi:hypothetical protein
MEPPVRILIAAIALLATAGPCRADVALGINFNWWRLDQRQIADCPGHPAAVLWGNGILSQYKQPEVRQAVKQQLTVMRQAGFTTLRAILNFRHPGPDRHEGPLVSTDGSLTETQRQSVREFVGDIAGAGFRTIELVPGPASRENNIYCRRNTWGDCFEPQRTEENWRFIVDTVEAATAAVGPHGLRFDLSNEACPAPNLAPATLANAKRYIQTIASRFSARFGDQWLFSCADSNNAVRLRLLLQDLGEAGLRPRYVEIHTYRTDPDELEKKLTAANEMAAGIGAELIIGEMRYHSTEQVEAIKAWLVRNPGSRLAEVLQWPLAQPKTRCPIDTPPPYTPGVFRELN